MESTCAAVWSDLGLDLPTYAQRWFMITPHRHSAPTPARVSDGYQTLALALTQSPPQIQIQIQIQGAKASIK